MMDLNKILHSAEESQIIKKYTYRQATVDDLPSLQALGRLSYGRYESVLTPEIWKQWEANFSSETYFSSLLEIATCFVCEEDTSIIGMAFIILNGHPTEFFQADWSYLRLVGVHPDHEGRGIGKALTKMCLAYTRQANEHTVALHTSEFQDAARHIYESMGFRKEKEFVHYGKRYWVYKLSLNGPESSTIEYFQATAGDIDIVVDYRIAFSDELVGKQDAAVEEELRKSLRSYFETELNRNYFCWYAKCGPEIAGIGGIGLRVLPGNIKNPSGKWGYIMSMYTVPAYRKLGICTNILNRLISTARDMGIKAVELHATPAGEPVYAQHGFVKHTEPTYRKFL